MVAPDRMVGCDGLAVMSRYCVLVTAGADVAEVIGVLRDKLHREVAVLLDLGNSKDHRLGAQVHPDEGIGCVSSSDQERRFLRLPMDCPLVSAYLGRTCRSLLADALGRVHRTDTIGQGRPHTKRLGSLHLLDVGLAGRTLAHGLFALVFAIRP